VGVRSVLAKSPEGADAAGRSGVWRDGCGYGTVKASRCELTSVATVEVGEGVVRESKGIEWWQQHSPTSVLSMLAQPLNPGFPYPFREGAPLSTGRTVCGSSLLLGGGRNEPTHARHLEVRKWA
jgi:hypothetical protein